MPALPSRARTKASGLRLLRLPGGGWSNTYGWLSCELGADQPGAQPCDENWETWAAKPSDFIAFLKATEVEGLWVVNPNSTAKEAAALVAFFNGHVTDTRSIGVDIRGTDWYTVGHWAALRASKGHTDPVPIKFWEFGNEVYASRADYAVPSSQARCQSGGAAWEKTWTCDGDEYVHGAISGTHVFEGYLAFRQAMQDVDPSIRLIAAGFEYPGTPSDTQAQWQTYAGWGSRLISAAGANLDVYGIHPYPYFRLPRAMRQVLDTPQWVWPYITNKLQQAFANYGAGHQPTIAVTEFNLVALQEMDADQWMTRAVNMLFLADAIGKAAQSGVGLFLQWDLANLPGSNNTEYGLMHPANSFYRAPQYYVYPLWSRFGTHMLALTSTAHGGTQLSVYAGRVTSDVISLLAINKAGAPVTANVSVNTFPPLSGGVIYEVRATSLASQSVLYNGSNNPSDDLTSAPPQPFSILGSAFSRVLPPYSVSLLHLYTSSSSTVTLMANPTMLPAGNASVLTATVINQFGNPVANGTVVSFTTSLGSISPVTATTIGGVVTATLSSTIAGVATVTATVGSLSTTAQVTFTPGAPFTLTLNAAPTTLPVGNSSALTATATDQYGNPVMDGTAISFTTSLGALSNGAASTSGGVVTATLSSTISGVATVTATLGSLNATALVTFTPGAPFTFTFVLAPAVIVANGISQSVATVAVVDQYGNPVGGVNVNFLAAIGAFLPASSATNAGGQVTAVLTSLIPAAEHVSAVVSGVGVRSALATYANPPASSAPLTATLRAVPHASGVVRKGDLITYTVTITNNGPGQVNNVSIIAPIPISTTYVAGSANGCYIGGSIATWMGNLPSNASHTLSYVVQAQILEGQVVKQPVVFVDGADTGIALSSAVDVVAYKAYLPTVRRDP